MIRTLGWVRRSILWLKADVAPGVRIDGRIWVPGPGRIRIGARARLGSPTASIELRAGPGAEIVIGEDAIIEGGCSIEAMRSVHIGARARICAFARIMDNAFHSATGSRREQPPSVAVKVGEGVIVGPRAILLPGADLGAGSRVGAATVVSKKVAEGMEIAGAPPRLRKALA